MEKNYPQNVEQYRKERNKKTLIRRLVILAVLLAVSVAVALGSDLISDIYGTVGTKFPISFSGERLQKFVRTKDCFIAVCEQQYIIYDDSGEKLAAVPHGFGGPQINLAAGNAVLYEPDGNHITLIENKKEILQKSLMDTIIAADVSGDGTFCALTTDERYLSAFVAFDKNGREKFRYACADQFIAVKLDGKKAVCAALRSQGGILQTVVTGLDFGKEEPAFVFTAENSLCLGIYKLSNAWSLLCDNRVLFFDDNGKILKEYSLAEKPVAWAVSDANNAGAAASGVIVVAVWEQGAYKIILYSKDKEIGCSAISDAPKAVAVTGKATYAVTAGDAYMFDRNGKEKRKTALARQADGIIVVRDHLYAVNDYQVSEIKF